MLSWLLSGCTAANWGTIGSLATRTRDQWSAREIAFADRCWDVRESESPVGAGPNRWSSGPDAVWVDAVGDLHLRVSPRGHHWYSAEVRTPLGGGYHNVAFQLRGALGTLDPQVVVGGFIYRNDASELDVELGRWGSPDPVSVQFVVPPVRPGRLVRQELDPAVTQLEAELAWTRAQVRFSAQTDVGEPVSWTYDQGPTPFPRRHWLHFNVWLLDGASPTTAEPTEIVIRATIDGTSDPRDGDETCARTSEGKQGRA